LNYNKYLEDPLATEQLAAALWMALPASPAGFIVLLQGELGSGKSTLARAMIRKAGHAGSVPSPTYTLVEPYTLDEVTIYHLDLYRIADASELEFLGWSDLDDGLRLIEWPERVPGLSKTSDLCVDLSYAGDGRHARISALSDRGSKVIAALAADKP
jgi:tRNA threonylcarbamoyladenosine biosynthesis protein TsaE